MAKDIFHDTVRSALEKEGWNITADPYRVKILGVQHDIDLGAERMLAAEKGSEKNSRRKQNLCGCFVCL